MYMCACVDNLAFENTNCNHLITCAHTCCFKKCVRLRKTQIYIYAQRNTWVKTADRMYSQVKRDEQNKSQREQQKKLKC